MAKISDNLRIVFMGTPEIAVASLKEIVDAGYNVVGVVTAPDKPAGRGKKIKSSPVKEFALKHGLLLLQPDNLKDIGFIDSLKKLKPDLQVVVAFRMLPQVVWEIPPLGTFNLHASLLPDLRGAAPINWAVIYGYKTTGVTTFFINNEIDKGNIIFREDVGIAPGETAGTLHDKLKEIGAKLTVKTIKQIEAGGFTAINQSDFEKEYNELKLAPKIYKEDCRINWNDNCENIVNFINGLNPVPGAFAELEINPALGKANYKILNANCILQAHQEAIGKVFCDGKNYIKIAVLGGFVNILTIQEPGKRLLSTPEYLRGVKF